MNSISQKSLLGYIFEVDLEYPDELHVLHNNYTLAPEKLAIPYDMLPGYCEKTVDEYELKVGDAKKLIPNLNKKTNYVLHYRNLKLHLSLGMKLTKIHWVLKLKQSDWMKKYINLDTEKRMIRCVYGKSNGKFTKKNEYQASKQVRRFF